MVCDCCGKRKKLFESYAVIQYKQNSIYLCVDCNDLAYKVKDDVNDKNKEKYDKHLNEWRRLAKKPTDLFLLWQQEFLMMLEGAFEKAKE